MKTKSSTSASLSALLLLTLTACTDRQARAESALEKAAVPLTDEAVLMAFAGAVDGPGSEPREGTTVDVSATILEALASSRECESPSQCELITRSSVVIKGATNPHPDWPQLEPIEEVALVGLSRDRTCEWSLVARSRSGWLDPMWLGVSAAGCKTPLDDGAIEHDGGLWFPIAVAHDGLAIRIEAQTIAHSEELVAIWDDPQKSAAISRTRAVLLCRVHPLGAGGLACTTASDPPTTMTGTTKALYAKAPLEPGSKLLPMSRSPEVTTLASRWLIAPPTDAEKPLLLAEVLSRYQSTETELHPLGEKLPTALVDRTNLSLLVLHRGAMTWLSTHYASYENETLHITRTERTPGLLRVDYERVFEGPTRVTWRFTELVTATHHVRLATGVELSVDGKPLRAWSRTIEADPKGVTLRASRGELAWFRGTGRFTYPELERAATRWRLGFARAWETVAHEPTSFPERNRSEFAMKEGRGRLVTLPGYAEPINWAVVDVVTPLPR